MNLVPVKGLSGCPTEQTPVYKKRLVFSPPVLLLKITYEDTMSSHQATGGMACGKEGVDTALRQLTYLGLNSNTTSSSCLSPLSLVTLLTTCL